MSNKGRQGKEGTKVINCESITTLNMYPMKESILGPIPEGVSIDIDYINKIASSMGLTVSDVINQWHSTLSQSNDLVNNLKDTIKGYQEENEKLKGEKMRYKGNYIEVKESYDRAVKECVELNDERKQLKEDIKILEDYYLDLQEDRNKLYQKTVNSKITEEYVKGIEQANQDLHKQLQENKKDYVAVREALDNARHESEELKNTILKLQEDLKESNNEVNHLKGKTEYMESQFKLNYDSLECAKTEIKSRIEDTEDLKKAIKTIAKHL